MDDRSFNEIAEKTLATNTETLQEIDHLLKAIEETKRQREVVFKEIGITPAMQTEHLSPSELSSTEQKLFEIIQKEFLEELAARGMNGDLQKTEKTKSKANLTLSRKRLRI